MSNGTEVEAVKEFASNIWQLFIQGKVNNLLGNYISYYRAEVVGNTGDGSLTVKRPFDTAIKIPCTPQMKNAELGTQVLVLVFGSYSNSLVVGEAQLQNLIEPQITSITDLVEVE